MAVTLDIGGVLHPIDKWDVGKRLSLAARGKAYGEANLVYSGPQYQSMQIQGKTIRLDFRFTEGMAAKGGGKLTGFAIAGADNKWSWGDATIQKDTVIVSAAAVAAPTQVRYGWGQAPPANLYNAAGLPAAPFQTGGAQLPVAIAREDGRMQTGSRLEIPWRTEPFSDALGRRLSGSRIRSGKSFAALRGSKAE